MSEPPVSLEEAWLEYLDWLTQRWGAPTHPGQGKSARRVFYAGATAAALLMAEGNRDALMRDLRKMRAEIDAEGGS